MHRQFTQADLVDAKLKAHRPEGHIPGSACKLHGDPEPGPASLTVHDVKDKAVAGRAVKYLQKFQFLLGHRLLFGLSCFNRIHNCQNMVGI